MSNIFSTPHSQPTPLALHTWCSAVAAVSQVDLLCVTPLQNYMTLAKKVNRNTEYKLHDAIQAWIAEMTAD